MVALGHALTIAANEWEWIHENPMRKISKLPEPRGRVRFLDDEERERLLEACKVFNESLSPYTCCFGLKYRGKIWGTY
jgi:phage gp16-like protein